MVVERYFYVQQLSFSLFGIDTKATKPGLIVKRPILCYIPLFFAILHLMAVVHYAYVNRHDYVEVTDSLAMFCQSLLSIWKLLIFLLKRREFVGMIQEIHLLNLSAAQQELQIVEAENKKDVKLCLLYFRAVQVAAFLAFGSPILEAIYIYCITGKLVLRVPYKASYFVNHAQLPGYCVVYFWNALSIYNLVGITLAIDLLFNWMVCNISAQFHILGFRFNEAGKLSNTGIKGDASKTRKISKAIKTCLKHHNQTLKLTEKLTRVYKEIIFIKFIISCSEICCLVFRLSRPSESVAAAAYQSMFLSNVAMQLMLYCYNGQRIIDESLNVGRNLYFAFDWSQLGKEWQKLLIIAIMCSQKGSNLKGIIFLLDLNLFLWAFKTAGSLITALKTMEENQD